MCGGLDTSVQTDHVLLYAVHVFFYLYMCVLCTLNIYMNVTLGLFSLTVCLHRDCVDVMCNSH